MTSPNQLTYIAAVEAVVIKDDRYLMIIRSEQEEHEPGMLSIPGGKVEYVDETDDPLEKTVRREILEETGVEVYPDMEYLESKVFPMSNNRLALDVVFLCRYKSGTAAAIDPAEVGAVAWMTAGEVMRHEKAREYIRHTIRRAEQRRNSNSTFYSNPHR